jgi:hypothetical protein
VIFFQHTVSGYCKFWLSKDRQPMITIENDSGSITKGNGSGVTAAIAAVQKEKTAELVPDHPVLPAPHLSNKSGMFNIDVAPSCL